jgi:hypothetical protein
MKKFSQHSSEIQFFGVTGFEQESFLYDIPVPKNEGNLCLNLPETSVSVEGFK